MMEWYVRQGDHLPVGPVSTELLARGIAAGKVADNALVCEAGTDVWRPVSAVETFRAVLSAIQVAASRPGAPPAEVSGDAPAPGAREATEYLPMDDQLRAGLRGVAARPGGQGTELMPMDDGLRAQLRGAAATPLPVPAPSAAPGNGTEFMPMSEAMRAQLGAAAASAGQSATVNQPLEDWLREELRSAAPAQAGSGTARMSMDEAARAGLLSQADRSMFALRADPVASPPALSLPLAPAPRRRAPSRSVWPRITVGVAAMAALGLLATKSRRVSDSETPAGSASVSASPSGSATAARGDEPPNASDGGRPADPPAVPAHNDDPYDTPPSASAAQAPSGRPPSPLPAPRGSTARTPTSARDAGLAVSPAEDVLQKILDPLLKDDD